jgi:hypothetical protein
MNRSLIIISILAALLLSACSSSRFSTFSDFDRSASIRNYESFMLLDSMAANLNANPILTNDFNRSRVLAAARKQFLLSGLVESNDPDSRVTITIRNVNRTSNQAVPMGGGFGYGYGYNRFGNSMPVTVEEVQIALAMRSALTGKLLWVGTVSGSISSFQRKPDVFIDAALEQLFSKYPGKKVARKKYDPVQ